MKSYRQLTFRYLKNQKKRTLLTILGVILSIALITAIGTMMESLNHKNLEDVKKSNGYYHTQLVDMTKEQLEILKKHIRVEQVGYKIEGGMAPVLRNTYIKIEGYDTNLREMMYISLLEGKMPEGDNEIALEKWMLQEMPGKPKIGETIVLDVEEISEQQVLEQIFGDKENQEDSVVKRVPHQFVLTGILENDADSQMKGISRGVVTPSTVEKLKENKGIRYNGFILIKEGLPIQKSIHEIAQNINLDKTQVKDNARLLFLIGQSQDQKSNDAVNNIIVFLVSLIVIATAAVIYNAFHISVLERIRQFGILRSVGTTPKQIREIVLGEALVIALIALPLGLASGILAVKIVLALLNLSKYSILATVEVIISPRVLLGSAVTGVIAVILSALSPAYLAGKVSPIQAITNRQKEKKAIKKARSYLMIRRFLGIGGEMAYKNLRRSRKRFAITVFSMCIGIVIFIVFNAFVHYMFQGMHGKDAFLKDYKIVQMGSNDTRGFTEKDYEDLKEISGVKTVYKDHFKSVMVTFPQNKMREEYKKELISRQGELQNLKGSECFKPLTSSLFWGYDDIGLAEAKKVLLSGTADREEINHEKGVLIVQNQEIRRNEDNNKAIIQSANLKVGDYIYIDVKEELYKEDAGVEGLQKVKIVGILDKVPLSYPYPSDSIAVISTEEVFQSLTGMSQYAGFDVEVDKDADKEALKPKLKEMAERVRGGTLIDYGEKAGVQEQARITVSVLLYGFVAVIALIGALNIINTISTNLILRTREFGTLRAVGMTMDQMQRMVITEGVLYGIIGAFWGSIIGTGLSYLLYQFAIEIEGMIWVFPTNAILIAGIGTIVITLLATLVPLKRVARMNIIESIGREE
ncbi:putative ABC transport system permease protein [Anaerosolibacter carboniphilus]|uniref:Putative ABC transport system permease protein n=1 Tax=Anaerosolibacter carboniphilus TaxID=1417629 RepID=A0A841KQI9_9FIRM|nr:ABC transporter permease [Anaerosolibacter carboniphilus]MBB6214360.1 putative ABC transport system permease protein [Anaerosolibacter carboniphilus]